MNIFNSSSIVDVCILKETHIGLVFISDQKFYTPGNLEYIFMTLPIYDAPGDNFVWEDTYWNSSVITHISPHELIVADFKGSVWYHNVIQDIPDTPLVWEPPADDIENIEENISTNIGIGLKDLVNIEGTIFAPALQRRVYVRNGASDWSEYNEPYFTPNANKFDVKGFNALDGFSKEDIYVVGGDRDVWHFNYTSKEWKQIDIGISKSLHCNTVCCAEDGTVYIGGQGGQLVWGRGDNWNHVNFPTTNQDIKKIVSYQGQIFVGMEQGTYTLKPIKDADSLDSFKLELYTFEELPDFNGGHMIYTAYNTMVIANYYNQIAFHDGNKWINIEDCDKPVHFSISNQKRADYQRLTKVAKTLDTLSDNLKDK